MRERAPSEPTSGLPRLFKPDLEHGPVIAPDLDEGLRPGLLQGLPDGLEVDLAVVVMDPEMMGVRGRQDDLDHGNGQGDLDLRPARAVILDQDLEPPELMAGL